MAGRHRGTVNRSRLWVPAACGLLLAAGLASVTVALGQPMDPPDLMPTSPSSEPSNVLVRLPAPPPRATPLTPPATVSDTTPSPASVDVGAEPPAALSIPAIDVRSPVNPLGLNADGSLEVPARGPLYDQAAWYTGSPSPGQEGPAVLLGHVNGRGGVPSVFARLAQLRVGDRVTVDRADGSVASFEVYLTEQYGKDEFPTAAVYGNTDGPELRLITCAGSWDAEVGHYRDNTVVYARHLTTG